LIAFWDPPSKEVELEVWTATKQESGRWLFEWDANSGDAFDIYLDGELVDTVVGESYEAELDGYDTSPPPLEIVADESGVYAESLLYPPYIILQWRGVDGAKAYAVEEYVSGSWIFRKTIMDSDAGYYTYQTEVLEDAVSTSFRVSALDDQGNAGTPVTFSFYVVRNPPPPDVDFSVESGGITVDES